MATVAYEPGFTTNNENGLCRQRHSIALQHSREDLLFSREHHHIGAIKSFLCDDNLTTCPALPS